MHPSEAAVAKIEKSLLKVMALIFPPGWVIFCFKTYPFSPKWIISPFKVPTKILLLSIGSLTLLMNDLLSISKMFTLLLLI